MVQLLDLIPIQLLEDANLNEGEKLVSSMRKKCSGRTVQHWKSPCFFNDLNHLRSSLSDEQEAFMILEHRKRENLLSSVNISLQNVSNVIDKFLE